MRILLCVPHLADNSLGRAFALALVAEELGHEVDVIGRGSSVWPPLVGTPFSGCCTPVTGANDHRAVVAADASDVIVAVKAWPESFRMARGLARRARRPVLVDVDDPDIEAALEASRVRDLLRIRTTLGSRPRHPAVLRLTRASVRRQPLSVSNPMLREFYPGAVVVPHVRPPRDPAPTRSGSPLVVAFVGTPRLHKGIAELRDAVARIQDAGVQLHITAGPPRDSRPWERWLGTTCLAEGARILDRADVVAIPSLDSWYGPHQFPVKLVDGMLAGRAILASDLPPLRWAAGATARLVPPGDVQGLADALIELKDPTLRSRLGAAAWDRATRMFTPRVVAPAFAQALDSAMATG